MKIILTGATGQIGSRLARILVDEGHDLICWTRSPASVEGTLPAHCRIEAWDPDDVQPSRLAGVDTVVHLAGEGIADGRWTDARKKRLVSSRCDTTRNLVDAMAALSEAQRPKSLVNASAIGFYGERGENLVLEDASAGEGFLAGLCADWEEEARRAEEFGVRTAIARIGVVLERDKGMLEPVLPLFRLGVAGRLGSGKQWFPWIHVEDVVGVLKFLIDSDELSGTWNAVAPNPVRNSEFTRALASALGRPALLPVPAFALKLAFGELAALMLASTRTDGSAIARAGYQFVHPDIESAVAEVASTDEQLIVREQYFDRSLEEVFAFFSDPRNLEELTPDFLNFSIVEIPEGDLQTGSEIRYRISLRGIPIGWRTEIRDWVDQEQFVDEQMSGPYALWHHTHTFEEDGEGTLMRDIVRYRLPLGALGRLVAGRWVDSDLDRVFSYRFTRMEELMAPEPARQQAAG